MQAFWKTDVDTSTVVMCLLISGRSHLMRQRLVLWLDIVPVYLWGFRFVGGPQAVGQWPLECCLHHILNHLSLTSTADGC